MFVPFPFLLSAEEPHDRRSRKRGTQGNPSKREAYRAPALVLVPSV